MPRWRRWKRPVFLALLIGFGVVGLALHRAAQAPDDSAVLTDTAAQTLRVYTTDPTAGLELTAELSRCGAREYERVSVNTDALGHAGATVLVLSDRPPSATVCIGDRLVPTRDITTGVAVRQVDGRGERPTTRAWAFERSLSAAAFETAGPDGVVVAAFELPPVTDSTGGRYFAHLPLLAPDEAGYSADAPLVTELDVATRALVGVRTDPAAVPAPPGAGRTADVAPAGYQVSPGATVGEVYWQSPRLTTREVLHETSVPLRDYRIDTTTPNTANFDGEQITWSGGGDLSASLVATELASEESRNRDNFLSGIAWATAAAAGIALLQELRCDLPWPGRRGRTRRRGRATALRAKRRGRAER